MKIVLRSPNWIGDCVMALPAIHALKQSLPNSKIFIITKEYLKDFFLNIDEIEGVITIPDKVSISNITKISKVIKSRGFDIGILFTNSFISAFLFKIAGIKKNYGYNRDLRGFLLNSKIKFPKNEKHHRFFYLDLINNIFETKITDISKNLIKFSIEEKAIAKRKMSEAGLNFEKKIIGLSTTAAYGNAKVWPAKMFTELIKKIQVKYPDIQIILFGSKKESSKIDIIKNEIKNNCFNFAGILTLRESMIGISLCDIFVSNDSGLMHLADTLNVPLIGIFGPTIPHKTKPIGMRTEILYKKVSCSPCKHRECPLDHKCMINITVEMVYNSIIEKINEK